jgi:OOP family OmpA-OmpF porin
MSAREVHMTRRLRTLLGLLILLSTGLGVRSPHAVAAPPASLNLAPPNAAIDVPIPDQPLPYLALLPGMLVQNFRVDVNAVDIVNHPERPEVFGPGPLRLDYVFTGQNHVGARQLIEVYRKALLAAGWTVDLLPGSIAVAHYLRPGRTLRLKLQADARALHVTLWEPAAQAHAPSLRDALEKKGSVVIYGIKFEIDKAPLRRESEPILQQILTLLKDTPALKIQVQVHSDNAFRDVYGRRPTHDRAHMIMRWLIEHGIAPERLTAQGYGETKPVDDNRTPEGRARNRRVELVKQP